MKKNYFSIIVFCCLIIFLNACGFHLKGEMVLAQPLHKMYLDTSDPYSYLVRNLQQDLRVSHVQLVPNREEADSVFVILHDENTQELLSVSGTQQTRQYSLVVTVTFEITNNKGVILVPPLTLQEKRTITVQANQILGSSNEANLYYQQMRQTLALEIMDRIASREVTRTLNETALKAKAS